VKFASLGSGSEGNALLVAASEGAVSTILMIDCGFGLRETEQRLARLGLRPADISAVAVTHEHSDHVGGVFKFARRHRIPVWLSQGTYSAVREQADGVDVCFCRDGSSFRGGVLTISPYTVPHDAREPLQYVVAAGEAQLGILTDAGHATPRMIAALSGCDALMLECNYDSQMLAQSTYPPSLKRRIGGQYGHLSNRAGTEILAAIDRSRLKTVVGAHLSKQNNTPALVLEALCSVVDANAMRVMVACQEQGLDWTEVA